MITCMIRYEIDSAQIETFEKFVTGWIPIVNRLGGEHHGCYLPGEGASDIAYALFSFPSLSAYEEFRKTFPYEADAQLLMQFAAQTRCVRRFERTFLRPALHSARESQTAYDGTIP